MQPLMSILIKKVIITQFFSVKLFFSSKTDPFQSLVIIPEHRSFGTLLSNDDIQFNVTI